MEAPTEPCLVNFSYEVIASKNQYADYQGEEDMQPRIPRES